MYSSPQTSGVTGLLMRVPRLKPALTGELGGLDEPILPSPFYLGEGGALLDNYIL
jgi:hypothetical protein